MNKAIIDNLNYYFSLDKPEYAFMISGDWGVGKTYFVKEYLKNRKSKLKIVWVSLFGVKNTIEIDQVIFQSLHPILSSKAVKISSNLLKGALSFGFKFDINLDGVPNEESMNLKLDGNGALDSLFGSNSEGLVFVFDDLERTGIAKKEILGYINRLIEEAEVKVIIIANENKLQDKCAEEDIYSEFKEKVIGKTFEVDHDFDVILDSFLSSEKCKFLLQHKEDIKQVYHLSNYRNLRKVKQSISDFLYLHENLDKKFSDNYSFTSSLVKSFFSLSFEIKKGVLKEEQLISHSVFSKDSEIYKKYFSRYPYLYSGKLWADILFKGNLNSLDDSTSKLTMFYKPEVPDVEEKPIWLKLWHYRNLENEEFTKLIAILLNEVKESHECKARDFLHKISTIIFFNKLNIIKIDLEDVSDWAASYIDKHEELDVWDNSTFNLSNPMNSTGYQYLAFDDPDFIRIGGSISEVNNKINLKRREIKESEYKSRLFNELLSGDIDKINEVLNLNNKSTPILSDLSPEDFVKSLTLMKNESINALSNILRNRYLTQDSLNGVKYGDYLKGEVLFWKELKLILDKNKNEGIRSLIICEFSETILSDIISRLS